MTLTGKTIALLISPKGTEQVEFIEPKKALEGAGATVRVISLGTHAAKAVNGDLDPADAHKVDLSIDEAVIEDFDGAVIPGGTVGADTLRADSRVIDFVTGIMRQGKPLGAICHAPWVLVEADVLKGRTVTSYPSLQTDIRNAGGTWVDREVVVDSGLVTSRNPNDLPAFCAKLIEEFGEGVHKRQSRSA